MQQKWRQLGIIGWLLAGSYVISNFNGSHNVPYPVIRERGLLSWQSDMLFACEFITHHKYWCGSGGKEVKYSCVTKGSSPHTCIINHPQLPPPPPPPNTIENNNNVSVMTFYLIQGIRVVLNVPCKLAVWIYDTFDHNFQIKNGLTKHLKVICFDWQFSLKIMLKSLKRLVNS